MVYGFLRDVYGKLWVFYGLFMGFPKPGFCEIWDVYGFFMGRIWVLLGRIWVLLGRIWVLLGRIWVILCFDHNLPNQNGSKYQNRCNNPKVAAQNSTLSHGLGKTSFQCCGRSSPFPYLRYLTTSRRLACSKSSFLSGGMAVNTGTVRGSG